jgi:hypothetical protein
VARHFVAARRYFPNELGLSLANPSEDEKSGLDLMHIQQVEQPLCIAHYSRREMVPLRPLHYVRERLDVKKVLNVDREDIGLNHRLL